MEWILAIIGGLAFVAAGSVPVLQFMLGAALGWALWRVLRLEERLRNLEGKALGDTKRPAAETPRAAPPVPAPAPQAPPPARPAVAAAPVLPAATPVASYDWRQNAILRWLVSGNVPAKAGVLVSFFGVAFLLKYAVEQGWMLLPVELRLAGVAAFGGALLFVGWRLRTSHRVYALSVQGGGIGVLYLAVYAALRLFQLLPAAVAFPCLVLVAAFAGWLALRQDARSLAVLGTVGGFLAPLLASTGTGSHVALFSYYLVLNIGVAGVAWFRHWRMLNLLGFFFTFGIGLAWGAQYYRAQNFASVEPFLVLHFLLYTAIAVLSALRQPFRLRGHVDSALVFGLPLAVFPLQAALVDGESLPLAWTASVLAVFYAGISWLLVKRFGEAMTLLAEVYVALAVIFGTLAIPLWLDAPWVSNTWALEAAAMIAIGIKQHRWLTHWAGIGLMLVAVLAYLAGLPELGSTPLLLSERFIGGAMLCSAASFCAWIYTVHPDAAPADLPLRWITATFAWFGWLLLAQVELFTHAPHRLEAAASLALFATMTVVLERISQRFAPHARVLATSLLPFMFIAWIAWLVERSPDLLADFGWMAWPVAFAALGWIVHGLAGWRTWTLPGALWLAALWLTAETDHVIGTWAPGTDWNLSAILFVLLGLVFFSDRFALRHYAAEYRRETALTPVLFAMIACVFLWNVHNPGNFAPLPYIPLLNMMLLTSAVIAVAVSSYGTMIFRPVHGWLPLAAFGLFLVSQEIARSVHHLGDVPFTARTLWRSGAFQSVLSITWSALGITAMVLGARLRHRMMWMAGAMLMAVVVVKLFGVDLGNTGSLTRVISFIGVGLLLLVVGYVAPVPAGVARGEVKAG